MRDTCKTCKWWQERGSICLGTEVEGVPSAKSKDIGYCVIKVAVTAEAFKTVVQGLTLEDFTCRSFDLSIQGEAGE